MGLFAELVVFWWPNLAMWDMRQSLAGVLSVKTPGPVLRSGSWQYSGN